MSGRAIKALNPRQRRASTAPLRGSLAKCAKKDKPADPPRSPAAPAIFEVRVMSERDPSPTNDANSESLAKRLACYAACPTLQDQPQIQRDLLSASRQVADLHDLLNAWAAVFAHRDIGQEFAEILGTAGMMKRGSAACNLKSLFRKSPMRLDGCAMRASEGRRI
jgi:hypothetical protein